MNIYDLKEKVEGDITTDIIDCYIQSIGASIYQEVPRAIVYPKSIFDLQQIVKYAKDEGIEVSSRGTGTSRVDASLSDGILINFTKHMNKILDIDENTVTVQPGITWRELDIYLKKQNKVFYPNPSSRMFCTIGGMAAMNASGENSIKFGDTFESIESIDFLLHDGSVINIKNKYYQRHEIECKNLRELYDGIYNIIDANNWILDNTPDAIRNCDGYNIWACKKNNRLNILKIIIGSEGTLGLFCNLKLKIYNRPKHIGVITVGFNKFDKIHMSSVVFKAKEYDPSAIEYIDQRVLELRRKYTPEEINWVNLDVNDMVFIEFEEYSENELNNKMDEMIKFIQMLDERIFCKCDNTEEGFQKRIALRRGTQALKNREHTGGKLAVAIIEDACVAPERVFDFINDLNLLLNKYDAEGFLAGHIGIGNIHTYPSFDLNKKSDRNKMVALSNEFVQIIKKYNGCITAEHGIGITRVDMLKSRYGEQIIDIFQCIKAVFDPDFCFNPGKIINYDKNKKENTKKYGQISDKLKEIYDIQEDVLDIIQKCHGCGKCLSFCPAYLTYKDENYTPRGRITFLFDLLCGDLNAAVINSEKVTKIWNTCFNCKSCIENCFDNLDVSKINRIIQRIQSFSEIKELVDKIEERYYTDLLF